MAYGSESPHSFTAGASLALLQHTFVKLDTTAGQVVGAGAGDQTLGVLANKPASGGAARVDTQAGCIVKLIVDGNAGAIAIGDYLKSDAAGKGVKSDTNLEKAGAIALAASTAAGDTIPAMLLQPGTERSKA